MGKVIIFSAPSGAGKTTIVQRLLSQNDQLDFSISACTRPRRTHEQHAKDYYFLSPEQFRRKIQENAFIEWEEVYENMYYGTLKSEVERIWKEGKHVLFDVDVKGGLHLKNFYQERALAIFIAAPSLQVLEDRLRNRDTDPEHSIRRRLAKAQQEISYEDQFDHVIVNDNLEEAVRQAQTLIEHFIYQESN